MTQSNPSVVQVALRRLAELVGPAAHKKLWGQATAAFAAAQALSGYAMSALYVAWGTYAPLFAMSSVMLIGGFLAGGAEPSAVAAAYSSLIRNGDNRARLSERHLTLRPPGAGAAAGSGLERRIPRVTRMAGCRDLSR